MNADRMNAVAVRLREDLRATNLVDLMAQLDTALTNASNAPQDPNYGNQVAQLRSQVMGVLASSDVNSFSPVERQVLDEWQVTDLLGEHLAERIDSIFQGNQITVPAAAQQIHDLVGPLQAVLTNLDALIPSLEFLHIGREELDAGQFEVDILIPRKAVRDELGELGQEFRAINEMLLPLVELSTGSRPSPEVRSIGSSDFTVFLWASPAAAACIATAVEKVLGVYKGILDIRIAKANIENLDIEAKDVIASSTRPLDDYANSLMASQTTEIAESLVTEFASEKLPHLRPNELKIEIRRSLLVMADRIDDGYNISVRTGPLPEAAGEDESPDTPAAQLRGHAASVQSRSESLKFMNLTGNPILASRVADTSGVDEKTKSDGPDGTTGGSTVSSTDEA